MQKGRTPGAAQIRSHRALTTVPPSPSASGAPGVSGEQAGEGGDGASVEQPVRRKVRVPSERSRPRT